MPQHMFIFKTFDTVQYSKQHLLDVVQMYTNFFLDFIVSKNPRTAQLFVHILKNKTKTKNITAKTKYVATQPMAERKIMNLVMICVFKGSRVLCSINDSTYSSPQLNQTFLILLLFSKFQVQNNAGLCLVIGINIVDSQRHVSLQYL